MLWGLLMSDINNLSDESIRILYDSIRQQVAEDVRLGSRHRLLGHTARERAERLREEMTRRRLYFSPIEW